MFGRDDTQWLVDSTDQDDSGVTVCPGWGILEWIGHLRGKAKLCRPINPKDADEWNRQADVLERRHARTVEHAQRQPG